MFCITKWTRHITDSGRDEYTGRLEAMKARLLKQYGTVPQLYRFRLLDDDGIVYAYGMSTRPDSFAPLDRYQFVYGCSEIQYKDQKTGKYETL